MRNNKGKRERRRVSFTLIKKVTKPVKIDFITRAGERVSFLATKKVTRPVKVEFYARR